jgi:hypothetical protein
MQKVVHLLEIFKTIFYFNFFELGRVLFELVKNSNEFKILNLKFGITLTGLICIQTGIVAPGSTCRPPFVSLIRTPPQHALALVAPPDRYSAPPRPPAPTSFVLHARGPPLSSLSPHGALTPGCPLPCSPHTPLLLLIQDGDWSAAASPWIVVAATVSPPFR